MPSLRRMCETCTEAVFTLMVSSAAICRFVYPRPSSCRTSSLARGQPRRVRRGRDRPHVGSRPDRGGPAGRAARARAAAGGLRAASRRVGGPRAPWSPPRSSSRPASARPRAAIGSTPSHTDGRVPPTRPPRRATAADRRRPSTPAVLRLGHGQPGGRVRRQGGRLPRRTPGLTQQVAPARRASSTAAASRRASARRPRSASTRRPSAHARGRLRSKSIDAAWRRLSSTAFAAASVSALPGRQLGPHDVVRRRGRRFEGGLGSGVQVLAGRVELAPPDAELGPPGCADSATRTPPPLRNAVASTSAARSQSPVPSSASARLAASTVPDARARCRAGGAFISPSSAIRAASGSRPAMIRASESYDVRPQEVRRGVAASPTARTPRTDRASPSSR